MSKTGWPGEISAGKRVASSVPSAWRTASGLPATPAGWRRTRPARLTGVSRRAVRLRSITTVAEVVAASAAMVSRPSMLPSRLRKRRSSRAPVAGNLAVDGDLGDGQGAPVGVADRAVDLADDLDAIEKQAEPAVPQVEGEGAEAHGLAVGLGGVRPGGHGGHAPSRLATLGSRRMLR